MRTSRLFIHSTITLGAAALLGAGLVSGASQEGPQATRAPQAPVTYPADQIKAGEPLFAAHCGFCHGRDATGGPTGPDLTRSIFVSEDVRGDKIKPLIKTGRPERGMPPISLSEAEMTSVVAYMHDRRIKEGSLVGARRRVSEDDLNTGDAKAGEAYFNGAGRLRHLPLPDRRSRRRGGPVQRARAAPAHVESRAAVAADRATPPRRP